MTVMTDDLLIELGVCCTQGTTGLFRRISAYLVLQQAAFARIGGGYVDGYMAQI